MNQYTSQTLPRIQIPNRLQNQDVNSDDNMSSQQSNVRLLTSKSITTKHRRKPASTTFPNTSNSLYGKKKQTTSTERLLPPLPKLNVDANSNSNAKSNPTSRIYPTLNQTPNPLKSTSVDLISKRSTWSSEAIDWDSSSPTAYFLDSPTGSKGFSLSDVNTQTVAEKYNFSPLISLQGLLIYPEDIEKDDDLHNPSPNDNDSRWDHLLSFRGFVNCTGLFLVILGMLGIFIGYPLISYFESILKDNQRQSYNCDLDPNCISGELPLMRNIRNGLIDPDTPSSILTKKSSDGKLMNLVFSDEFNDNSRTFYNGDDPYWEAVDLWYGVTRDIEWYDPDAITTKNGSLVIQFDKFQNHGLKYRSGMLQSWNKLCFKGGRLEASISLPGKGDISGFWPGFWSMGNLGRPGYASTTDGMWPYSYVDVCDAGITPNQSDSSGISYLPGMKLPACTCKGEDHPSPGISRSSPEIDVIEASVTTLNPGSSLKVGTASQSLQCAPFDPFWQPDYNYVQINDYSLTTMNNYQGSNYQQAISGVTTLNNSWYNGEKFQTYAFEYVPGKKGEIKWFIGNHSTWSMDYKALRPNGNINQRVLPLEPMSLILNFGLSEGFAYLDINGLEKTMPATMYIDYVRIYQEEGKESITCDPPGYETTDYISKHMDAYTNPNLTHWSNTSYSWPKNSLMNGCEASNYTP